MILELNHVGLFVRDMSRSLSFYRDALGGTVVFRGIRAAGPNEIVYLQFGTGLVELISGPAPDPTWGNRGLHHLAFISDDLDADFPRLTQAGATPWRQPTLAGTGAGRVGFLLDPNGIRVELLERDGKSRSRHSEQSGLAVLDHLAITVGNHNSAASFYGHEMGMEILPLPTDKSGAHQVSYLGLKQDILEIHSYTLSRNRAHIGHMGFYVASVPEALGVFRRHRIAAASGYPRRASMGAGSIALIHDPDGNEVELLDRRPLGRDMRPGNASATDGEAEAQSVNP